MTHRRAFVALFLFTVFGAHFALASGQGPFWSKASRPNANSAPDSWLGGFGIWSNPGHWSDGVPGADSDVFIATGNDSVSLNVSSRVMSLELGGASGNSTLDGTLGQTLNIFDTFTVNPSGTFYLGNGGSLTATTIRSNGTIDVFTSHDHISGQELNNYSTGFFNIDFGHGSFVTVNNYGSVDVHDGQADLLTSGDFNNYAQTNVFMRGHLGVADTLANYSGAALNISGPGANATANILINYGAINQTNGNLSAATLANGGTIQADRLSRIQVGNGNTETTGYCQYDDGTLVEAVGAGYFGVLTIDGPAIVDGELDIVLENGFVPMIGSIYKFMNFTPGELSGRFDGVQNSYFDGGQEMWEIQYDNADGFIELVAVPSPEPGSILLIGSGLIAITGRIRKVS